MLVEIRAFGVGIHDRYFIPPDARFPYPIGTEGAGVVVKTGEDVKDFAPGDRGMLSTVLQPQGGTWAPFAVAPAQAVMKMPDGLAFEQAAGIPWRANPRSRA